MMLILYLASQKKKWKICIKYVFEKNEKNFKKVLTKKKTYCIIQIVPTQKGIKKYIEK